jgi:hypothetical protein
MREQFVWLVDGWHLTPRYHFSFQLSAIKTV